MRYRDVLDMRKPAAMLKSSSKSGDDSIMKAKRGKYI
jgi:hypothetical protein